MKITAMAVTPSAFSPCDSFGVNLLAREDLGMHPNKPKFDLACKIIGLILVISGIYMGFQAMLILVEKPADTPPHPSVKMPAQFQNYLHETDLIQQQDVTDIWKKFLVALTFKSTLPLLLGLYLMKPDNIFSQYAYPVDHRPAEHNPCEADVISVAAMQQDLALVDDVKRYAMGNGSSKPVDSEANSGLNSAHNDHGSTPHDHFRL